ncbi:MAG: hypothetical protein JWQ88_3522 [Rhodoferax sp.]|nr:hypothetical protein [Rhodoferax sp.]
MRAVHRLKTAGVARLLVLATLLAGGSAFGALGAHYRGFGPDRSEFRLYLDGGEFLGRKGSFQAIRVTVHQLRKNRPQRTLEGCVYRFDDMDRRRDRIECAESAPAPLAGVEYARPPAKDAKHAKYADAVDALVCVRRCHPVVPSRLSLEGADDDNG